MTPLGDITIRTASSVYDARNKVLALAGALGFDEITATRLATATSQVCRALAAGGGDARMTFALRTTDERAALVLSYKGRVNAGDHGWLMTLFDAIEPCRGDDGNAPGLTARKWLPAGARQLSPNELETQRQRLLQRSREDLMQEIQAQNQSLERHSAQLEQTVTERTVELRRAMDVAEAANRAKSEFLSNMSHELRTPLNGVLGYAQILQRDKSVSPKHRASLEAIQSCGQHLLTLINDVLDLSKIEAGRMEVDPAPCDIHELLKSVHDILRPRAEGRGVRFELTIEPGLPAGVITDKTKLKQTIINLAGNAVKFTEKGSVALRALREQGEMVICVQDTGMGMSPQEAASVFTTFKQGEGGRKHGGTGLGLAISRRLIEMMGGTISVESEKGVGSTFTVRLPLTEADVLRLTDAGDSIGDSSDLVLTPGQEVQVLIADDVPVNRDILQTILQDAGFRTLEAENGKQVIELLRQHRCPLVLMDVRMPVMDGIEATAAIRADPELTKTKVIAVTASVIDFNDRVAEYRFDGLVGKPVHVKELFEALRQHLGVRYVDRATAASAAATSAGPAPTAPPAAMAAERSPLALPAPDMAAAIALRLRSALKVRNLTALNALSGELSADPAAAAIGQRIGELAQRFDFKGLDRLATQLEAASGAPA